MNDQGIIAKAQADKTDTDWVLDLKKEQLSPQLVERLLNANTDLIENLNEIGALEKLSGLNWKVDVDVVENSNVKELYQGLGYFERIAKVDMVSDGGLRASFYVETDAANHDQSYNGIDSIRDFYSNATVQSADECELTINGNEVDHVDNEVINHLKPAWEASALAKMNIMPESFEPFADLNLPYLMKAVETPVREIEEKFVSREPLEDDFVAAVNELYPSLRPSVVLNSYGLGHKDPEIVIDRAAEKLLEDPEGLTKAKRFKIEADMGSSESNIRATIPGESPYKAAAEELILADREGDMLVIRDAVHKAFDEIKMEESIEISIDEGGLRFAGFEANNSWHRVQLDNETMAPDLSAITDRLGLSESAKENLVAAIEQCAEDQGIAPLYGRDGADELVRELAEALGQNLKLIDNEHSYSLVEEKDGGTAITRREFENLSDVHQTLREELAQAGERITHEAPKVGREDRNKHERGPSIGM